MVASMILLLPLKKRVFCKLAFWDYLFLPISTNKSMEPLPAVTGTRAQGPTLRAHTV